MFWPYMAIIRFCQLRFRYINCMKGLRCGDLPSDYSSNIPMYRQVLCDTDTCIYCLSIGRGVSSWGCLAGCQPPFLGGCCHEAVYGWP